MSKILFLTFIGLISFTRSYANSVCTKFSLNAPNEDIVSPIKIKTLYISDSIFESTNDQTKFLIDYSDGKNLNQKHAFADCRPMNLKSNKLYFICADDGYEFNLDLTSRKTPELHLNYISLVASGAKNYSIKAKNNNLSISGKYVKCPEEPKELIIINSN